MSYVGLMEQCVPIKNSNMLMYNLIWVWWKPCSPIKIVRINPFALKKQSSDMGGGLGREVDIYETTSPVKCGVCG